MKNVILSADGDYMLYAVPDIVADDLGRYCMEFCTEWLFTSPRAERYRRSLPGGIVGVCYNEEDFIAYLNQWVFPQEQSVLIKSLGAHIAKEYADFPAFYF